MDDKIRAKIMKFYGEQLVHIGCNQKTDYYAISSGFFIRYMNTSTYHFQKYNVPIKLDPFGPIDQPIEDYYDFKCPVCGLWSMIDITSSGAGFQLKEKKL